jgi:hypothetical protein
MTEAWLSFEERKTILKWNLKLEKFVEMQRQWRREYATELPTRLTSARICDKFETHGTLCDVHNGRSGRPRTATSPPWATLVIAEEKRDLYSSIFLAPPVFGTSTPVRNKVLFKFDIACFHETCQRSDW